MKTNESTLLRYFSKTSGDSPMRNLTNLNEADTPIGKKNTPFGGSSKKRKPENPSPAALPEASKRRLDAGEAQKQDRAICGPHDASAKKDRLQELLGEGSSREKNLE